MAAAAEMPIKRRTFTVKIFLDLAILLTVGIPILVFYLHGRPKHRGFFCDDDSIRYPYHDSTVSNDVLYILGVFLPTLTITATECVNGRHGGWMPVVWSVYRRVGVFLFGACLSQLTTDVAKYSVGRLRPHFLDVCRPDLNCSSTDPHRYIEQYVCTGTDAHRMREARLSFPSGHSSFSAYAMVYTTLYLQACMRCRRTNHLLRPFLQFCLLTLTWYTALSRVADYKHHWSDVLCGFLLGTLVAILVVFFVSDCFSRADARASDSRGEPPMPMATQTSYSTMEVEERVP